MTVFYFMLCVISGLVFLGIFISLLTTPSHKFEAFSVTKIAKILVGLAVSGTIFMMGLSLLIEEESKQLGNQAQECLDRGGLVVRRETGTYIGCAEDR